MKQPCRCGCGGLTKREYIRGHRPPKPISERFWEKVDKSGDCWLWTAALSPEGYGTLSVGGRGEGMVSAHRVSWQLAFGPIPVDKEVCHHCDVRPCVRPDHLFLGTRKDNMIDCSNKGRTSWQQRERCVNGHPFDGPHVIIKYSANGRPFRRCLLCARAASVRYRKRQRGGVENSAGA